LKLEETITVEISRNLFGNETSLMGDASKCLALERFDDERMDRNVFKEDVVLHSLEIRRRSSETVDKHYKMRSFFVDLDMDRNFF